MVSYAMNFWESVMSCEVRHKKPQVFSGMCKVVTQNLQYNINKLH